MWISSTRLITLVKSRIIFSILLLDQWMSSEQKYEIVLARQIFCIEKRDGKLSN